MSNHPPRRRRRRGISTIQWALIAALIVVVVIGTVTSLGNLTNQRLETTTGGVGNPSQLKHIVAP